MKVQSVKQTPNSSSVSHLEYIKDEKSYQVSWKQREQAVNRLYDMNQFDDNQLDYKNIVKIQDNSKKTLNKQKSTIGQTPQEDNIESGVIKYGIDRKIFGIKDTIYFQIPSTISLIGSYRCFIYFGGFFTFYFLLFGIVTVGLALTNSQVSIRYDNHPGCENQKECIFEFEITEYLKAPVHIYYSLGTFHQNHFQYQDSIVYEQLRGEHVDSSILKEKCAGALLNGDMFLPTQVPISVTGNRMSPNEIAYPCGMASKWVFNDSFQIQRYDGGEILSKTIYEIDKKGIALNIDREDKFKRPNDFEKIAFRDMQDGIQNFLNQFDNNVYQIIESFMNWINTPTLPIWKKLYGNIFVSMDVGRYKITIQNNFDSSLGTEKTIYLQTANAIGSKNLTFGIILMVSSFFFLIGTIILLVKNKQNKVQSEFNPKDLVWF